MKRAILFLLLFPLCGMAQDYRPVATNHIRFFHTASPFTVGSINDIRFEDFGINIDSVTPFNGDSIYYNYQQIREYDGFQFGGTCAYKQYSWLGLPIVVKSNGWTYFVNQNQDSIKINHTAQMFDSWICLQISPNNLVWATVTDLSPETVLGVTENVKTISFECRNAASQVVSHVLNGESIKIAETLGLVQGLDFYHFPNHIETEFLGSFPITGIGEWGIGIRRMTNDQLFEELEVGDEFSYRGWLNDHQAVNLNPVQHEQFLIQVIGKSIIPSLQYTIVEHVKSKVWLPDYTEPFPSFQLVTSYSTDTLIVSSQDLWPFYTDSATSKMPGEYSDVVNFGLGFNTDFRLINDTASLSHFRTEFGDLDSSGCIDDGSFEYMPWNIKYVEHLGAVWGQTSNAYDDSEFRLDYLKRAGNIWGNPVSVSFILGAIKTPFTETTPIYPNPIQIGNQLNLGAYFKLVDVLDMSGKVVLSKQQSATLETNELKAGVYLIRLQTDDRLSTQKLVVTD